MMHLERVGHQLQRSCFRRRLRLKVILILKPVKKAQLRPSLLRQAR
jgi:hypothetical protein